MKLLAFLTALCISFIPAAWAQKPLGGVQVEDVVLYQNGDVLRSRIESMRGFETYIRKLQDECIKYLTTEKTPETLDIVVAVRPGQLSRIWLISSIKSASDPQRELFRKGLEFIPACSVHQGPVAFALIAKIAGGDGKNPSKGDKSINQPFPQEWINVRDNKPGAFLVPDDILDIIWPVGKDIYKNNKF